MTKCRFCHFENEDGALFCEQCKSDLAIPAPEPVAAREPEPEPVPMAAIPVEAFSPGLPAAQPVVMEAIPVASAEAGALPVAAEVMPASVKAHPVNVLPPEPIVAPPQPAVSAPSAPSPAPVAPVPAVEVPAAAPSVLPPEAQPRLLVLRGQKRNVEYPLYDGLNFVGRADDKPVDIDLEDQEPPDRVWCSRQHCCISFENGKLEIEDLNSANGTFVNRQRIYPGQKKEIYVSDIIQIGNVQLKVIV
jgi:hypothetical protein